MNCFIFIIASTYTKPREIKCNVEKAAVFILTEVLKIAAKECRMKPYSVVNIHDFSVISFPATIELASLWAPVVNSLCQRWELFH